MERRVTAAKAGGKKRTPIFGPEPWTEIGGTTWSHFDRWYALVIVHDHDGDPGGLEADLVGRLRSLSGRDDVEAKLAHLAWLTDELNAAGLRFEDLAGAETADTSTLAKARRKVLDQALEGRSITPAMLDTPRRRLQRRARRGHWPVFPAPVEPWYTQLGGDPDGTSGFITAGRSFNAARRLGRHLERLDAKRLVASERLGLHRAFHTAGLDLADAADDSYGAIGDLREEAFATYLALDWRATGIAPDAYWQDLCELLTWEPYGLSFRTPEAPFRHVKAVEAAPIETALLALADEHRTAHLDWAADEARQQVAWLHLAGQRLTRYLDTATLLGSDHWMPIVALAESALRHHIPKLALDIFLAADQPGPHRDTLRDRCHQLTGTDLATT